MLQKSLQNCLKQLFINAKIYFFSRLLVAVVSAFWFLRRLKHKLATKNKSVGTYRSVISTLREFPKVQKLLKFLLLKLTFLKKYIVQLFYRFLIDSFLLLEKIPFENRSFFSHQNSEWTKIPKALTKLIYQDIKTQFSPKLPA